MTTNSQPRVLVTGGAGFIGSHLTEALVKSGCRVRVLDNLHSGDLAFLASVCDKVEFINQDILDLPRLIQAMDGIRVVYHLAALASVTESLKEPDSYLATNGRGTLNVFQAAWEKKVARVVTASSSAVYGDGPSPSEETQAPRADTPYAATKLLAENLGLFFQQFRGLEVVSLRLFNVYGPRQAAAGPEASVIPVFVQAAIDGQRPVIYGDGEQTRDFIEVRDAVRAFMAAGSRPLARSGVYNVGTGETVSVNRLYGLLKELAPGLPQARYAPFRPGDVLSSVAKTERTRKNLKFSAHIDIREGLASLLAAGGPKKDFSISKNRV
ncbi:MAG: GDP-mannose 4,6-dehydratase [Deltaproteobacteria bacterium]|jgi:UDP-glucose 4-epimerase|nr:GDP-mannose 4,6-dehydratase [Deltaproteobacteria bacterium]